jgi:UDP-N-acetylmuramoyl-L-alanyl-D-glutamate--2,6-diaminopimelate ligase
MKLRELLAAVPSISFDAKHPALDAEVKALSTNSHACKSGDLFLGMPRITAEAQRGQRKRKKRVI